MTTARVSAIDEDLARRAFPVIGDGELEALKARGATRRVEAGDLLFASEEPEYPLVVTLSGRLEIRDPDGVVLGNIGPNEFAGELGLLLGQTTFADCRATEPGEVLVVQRGDLLDLIHADPDVSDLIVGAFAARRMVLMRRGQTTLTIVGRDGSTELQHLLEYADRSRIPHRWLDPDDPDAADEIRECAAEGPGVHVVVRGRQVLKNPSIGDVARALGLELRVGPCEPQDLVIVGAGPAGLAAAVYGASEGLSTVVVDDVAIGGQAGTSSRIENYLGFPTGISGGDLAFNAEVQAIKFGAQIAVPRHARSLRASGGRYAGYYEVALDDGAILLGRSVVIATGARYRKLGLPSEAQFEGAGLYYAATELEARACRGKQVVVVGAGNSGGQAAMYLSRQVACVHLVCRGRSLASTMSQYLVDRLERAPNVRIHLGAGVAALAGERRLESVTIEGPDAATEQPACGLFVMIGAAPCTDWLRDTVELDEHGFVATGGPGRSPFETSLPGVYAVGDVRAESVKRVASAVGEGSVVVQAVHQRLAALRERAAAE
ncbi:MAG TPA: FAD-dependent oxidoreductase [Caulobacteraceae bacterium]|jgi:thioredoxin reductase (NADPH)